MSAMKGILLLTFWKSSSVRSTPAVPAMARVWRTPFVEPPRAIIITSAFSNDFFVKQSLGLMFRSMQILIASAALWHSRILAGEVAGVEDEPGSERPRVSIIIAIVLAVNMPPQAPEPGQDSFSRSVRISSCVCEGSSGFLSRL
jgi:hypothetical protein